MGVVVPSHCVTGSCSEFQAIGLLVAGRGASVWAATARNDVAWLPKSLGMLAGAAQGRLETNSFSQ